MTPTLSGRIQTRWLLLVIVGVPWTIVVGPLLWPLAFGPSLGEVYGLAFLALLIIGVLGTAWEFLYHALQQLRWEKDWPALLGLVTGVNEFIALVVTLLVLGLPVPFAIWVHFATTWFLIWFVANGPLRVLLPRWRYHGGSLR